MSAAMYMLYAQLFVAVVLMSHNRDVQQLMSTSYIQEFSPQLLEGTLIESCAGCVLDTCLSLSMGSFVLCSQNCSRGALLW